MKAFISSFLVFIFFISCKMDEKKMVLKDFPMTYNLESRKIKVPEVLYHVTQINALDNFLVSMDFQADTIFQIFSLPDFKHLGGFIHRGRGPGELQEIDPILLRNYHSDDFYFVSNGSVHYVTYLDTAFTIAGKIELNSELRFMNQVVILDSLTIIGYDIYRNEEREFIKYNSDRDNYTAFGPEYPEFTKGIRSDRKIMASTKSLTLKPDKSRFAALYDKVQMMRIYSRNGELIKEVVFKDSPHPSIKFLNGDISNLSNEVIHYIKIQSTDKYIYGLYIGKKMEELPPGLSSLPCELHVWDWEGSPIASYRIKDKLFSFDITKDDKILIGSSLEEINTFFTYPLIHDY